MSYDLYFYKKKGASVTEAQIADYLTTNLTAVDENNNQWFFENKETEVYYSFEKNEPEDDPESIELYESFEEFENTRFSFNLNFIRPSFFGLEAFQFMERFIADLELFVLNPQSEFENPYTPSKDELYDNWNQTNLRSSADYFDELEGTYFPIDKSNEAWEFNFNRDNLQKTLGEDYFVPRLFFFKTKKDNTAITITTWTEHIPTVIPPADYFILTRNYKKLFTVVKEKVLVSREALLKNFDSYFAEFNYKNCMIIHPDNAAKVKNIFNSIKSDDTLEEFAERVAIEQLMNAKPEVM